MAKHESHARAAGKSEAATETPDETTGLSLAVAALALGAFVTLGSAAPYGHGETLDGHAAIEVTEETEGAESAEVADPVQREAEPTPSDTPKVDVNELAVEAETEQVDAEAAMVPAVPPNAEPAPVGEQPTVPKIVLEEEPAPPVAPAAPPPVAPPAVAPQQPVAPVAAVAPAAPVAPAPHQPVAPAPAAPAPAAPAPAPKAPNPTPAEPKAPTAPVPPPAAPNPY